MSRISWTPENDQLLFFLTLRCIDTKIDANAIERAWPQDRTPKPTARAIQERVVKIRKKAVALGAGDFRISGTSNPGTPSKGSSSKGSPSKTPHYKAGGGIKGRAVHPPVSFTTARPDSRMKRVKVEEDEEDSDASGSRARAYREAREDFILTNGEAERRKMVMMGGGKKRKLSARGSDDDDDEGADGDGEGLSAGRARRASKAPAYDADDDEDGAGSAALEEDSGDDYAEEV